MFKVYLINDIFLIIFLFINVHNFRSNFDRLIEKKNQTEQLIRDDNSS